MDGKGGSRPVAPALPGRAGVSPFFPPGHCSTPWQARAPSELSTKRLSEGLHHVAVLAVIRLQRLPVYFDEGLGPVDFRELHVDVGFGLQRWDALLDEPA
ncbi:MAG: hypothetical protein Kow0069_27220 [Promethearchaeota archaeon]